MRRSNGGSIMDRPIVAIADTAFADHDTVLRDFGDRAVLRWVDISTPAATRLSTQGADAVVVTLQRLSDKVIAAFDTSVRVIGRAGVGLDTIDLEAARARSVAVINQPAYGAQEVASHAVALMLATQRHLLAGDTFVRNGWQGAVQLGPIRPLDEAVVGVVGCGRIGRAFIDYILPMVGEVLVHDPLVNDVPAGVQHVGDLGALLVRSQVLSLHLPLSEQSRNLIGRRELLSLPRGAVVINVSRGGLVDEVALAELLHSGHLGGAGLDVFAQEPLPPGSPLLSTPNTVLTPHSASVSDRAARRLSHWTISDVLQYLTNGSITNGALVADPRELTRTHP